MTRKDFELIAAALHDTLDDHQQAGRAAHANGIMDVMVVLSRRLKDENARFDRKRFLIACGYPTDSRLLADM